MRSTGELWEAIGAVETEDTGHVLARLFTMYEQLLATDAENTEAVNFFKKLDIALTQTAACNLNRR